MTLRDDHHYVRNVGRSKIEDDGSIDGSAFELRPGVDADGLSGNWPEFFANLPLPDAMVRIRAAYIAKGRTLAAQSRFALLNVGRTRGDV
ncbi:MAG TPA: hypothetical protein VF744_07515, partial [Beijerinckiaceae bacterium]